MYNFDPRLAKKYGVDEAIILQNIIFWIAKNKANDRHFYDGDHWTYNSASAFCKLFEFWSQRQIERILKSLRDQGALKVGNYNQSTYDRTMWYAVTDEVKSIISNGDFHLPKKGNGFAETSRPIPDINTYNKPDINTNKNIVTNRAQSVNEPTTNEHESWKPNKQILEAMLQRACVPFPTQQELDSMLVTFNPHYETKVLTDNQKHAKLVDWIKRSRPSARIKKPSPDNFAQKDYGQSGVL